MNKREQRVHRVESLERAAIDRAIGLLLPCNVVLRGTGEAVEVSILDPEVMFQVVEPHTQQALATLPMEAKSRLQAALAALT